MSRLYTVEIVNAPLREGKPTLQGKFTTLGEALAWKDSIELMGLWYPDARTMEYKVWDDDGMTRFVLLDYTKDAEHRAVVRNDNALIRKILKEEAKSG